MRRPRTRTLLRWLFAALVVAAAAVALAKQRSAVADALEETSWLGVALALPFVVLALLFSLLSWRAVLADLGSPLPLRGGARVFFLAQLGKYLPGSVWPVVAQMELGRDLHVPRPRSAAGGVLAMAYGGVSALLVATVALPLAGQGGEYAWALALAVPALVVVHPRVLGPLLNRALRLVRRPPLERRPSLGGTARGVGWAAASWTANGLHVWVLARAVGGTSARLPLLAVGALSVAWAVGFLVVVAPAGAGVREAALVALLATSLPTGAATAVALLSRAIMTVGDVAAAGVAAATTPRRDRELAEHPPSDLPEPDPGPRTP